MTDANDKTNEVFSCSKWIRERPLNIDTVEEYFQLSSFYQHHDPSEVFF